MGSWFRFGRFSHDSHSYVCGGARAGCSSPNSLITPVESHSSSSNRISAPLQPHRCAAAPKWLQLKGFKCNIGAIVTVSGPGMSVFLIVGIDDDGGEEWQLLLFKLEISQPMGWQSSLIEVSTFHWIPHLYLIPLNHELRRQECHASQSQDWPFNG